MVEVSSAEMMLGRIWRRGFLVALLLGAMNWDLLAHAKLVRSTPRNGSEVKETPKLVELWFNELLDEGFNSVEVYRAAERSNKERKNLAKGKARVDARDRTRLSVEVEKLFAGEYVVEYRVLSRDGHSATGRLKFKVAGAS